MIGHIAAWQFAMACSKDHDTEKHRQILQKRKSQDENKSNKYKKAKPIAYLHNK